MLWRTGTLRTTAVVVGNEFTTHELTLEIEDHRQLGIDVVGQLESRNDGSLSRFVRDNCPDRVILAGDDTQADMELAASLNSAAVRVYVMPHIMVPKTGSAWFTPHQMNGFPLIRTDTQGRPLYSRVLSPTRRLFAGATS